MKNEIYMQALPPVELVIALNSGYPSKTAPMFVLTTPFYNKWQVQMENFLKAQLSQKWTEEMPVLYELAIFI